MPLLAQITPLISVTDIARSIDFYSTTLEFKSGYRSEDYAYLYRDNVAVRLLKSSEAELMRGHRRFYIDVEGVDELYDSLFDNLKKLPKGRVKVPFNQPYGQREFHVIDDDQVVLMFGEPLKQSA